MYNAGEYLEIFDSLGVKKNLIQSNVPAYTKTVYGNATPVQGTDSSSCGQFCCYFLLHRYLSLDVEFEDLLNCIFSSDLVQNEEVVLDFVSK